ncbi:MAG: deacylase [Desulfovibrionaceae bacterium]|jgi:hypothetical protein|nr:deacylase [Desulfovibrionaceae bacterium]
MKRTAPILLLLLALTWPHPSWANNLDFTLHKLGTPGTGHTLLIVGGIQGDEPGGFNAASLIVSNYRITKGSVWVVPNLNFISIINRSRGVYGDLNRKFSVLANTDPEYETIRKIKALITDPQIDAVLNLHDGSGFFRPDYEDRMHCPLRWGQSVIIDQAAIDGVPFGDLATHARRAADHANGHLYDEEHRVHVKNTHTRLGDMEMEKTLTYFAINNGKPAFGLEASKSFPTNMRSYYHLRMVESFLHELGIEYERTFDLSAQGVEEAIDSNVALAFYDNRIFLDLRNARNRLRFIPFKKNSQIAFTPSNPLMAVIGTPSSYSVFYGNRNVTRLDPEYLEFEDGLDEVNMVVDGQPCSVRFGNVVGVGESFKVIPPDGYRANVIGYRGPRARSDGNVIIRYDDFLPDYSVDKKARIFRVEIYKLRKFAGMVLVDFDGKPKYEAYNTFHGHDLDTHLAGTRNSLGLEDATGEDANASR